MKRFSYITLTLLSIFVFQIGCTMQQEQDTKKERFIEIENNIKLWTETYGNPSDKACLFISGAGANSTFWSERLCNKLVGKGYFVIKYDHRDFGFSTKIDWEQNPYDFMQLAKDALSILDDLKVEKAHVVGHSMGGFIVQLLAIHYPERIKSITSISATSSSPSVPMPPDKTWEIYLANKPQNDIEKDLDGFLKVWEYLNGTAKFDKELAVTYTKNLYARQPIDGALGASHVKAQATLTDRTEQLKKLTIPTLVMHGEEDYAVDTYGGIQTAESIPNAKLVIIPEMGHIPFNHLILQRFENEIIDFIEEQ